MTDHTRSTIAILQEALDTITATYWIKGDEFSFIYQGDIEHTEKKIGVQLDNSWSWDTSTINPEGKAAIKGVCSIGALALASYTLYDEPLASFNTACERDPLVLAASAALVAVIVEQEGHWLINYDSMGSLIAAWNDEDSRTREEVVKMFAAAMKHSLATTDTLWGLEYTSHDWTSLTNVLYFATKDEAEAFGRGIVAETEWQDQDEEYTKVHPAPALTGAQEAFMEQWGGFHKFKAIEIHSLVPQPA